MTFQKHTARHQAPIRKALKIGAILVEAVWWTSSAHAGDAGCGWAHGFHQPGMNAEVNDIVSWDDGRGEAIYAGGEFSAIGNEEIAALSRWDGHHWNPLIGPQGGAFASGDDIYALAVWDDGTGEKLYVGGDFTSVDGVTANGVAAWDGTTWSSLTGSSGTGLDGFVRSLFIWDDGSGEKLYIGGGFDQAGGVAAKNIATWDGRDWATLADGGLNGEVHTFETWDDGHGEALFVGGDFAFSADSQLQLRSVARWDGVTWTGLDDPTSAGTDGSVRALAAGPQGLLVAGDFESPASRLAIWDGAQWSAFSSDVIEDEIRDVVFWNDGQGQHLYIFGDFETAGEAAVDGFARWEDDRWVALGGLGNGDTGRRFEGLKLYPFLGGTTPMLVAGGVFTSTGGEGASFISRWTGSGWDPFPTTGQGAAANNPSTSAIFDSVLWDDGSGESLYAVGDFGPLGGADSVHIARWDGDGWHRLAPPGTSVITGDRLTAVEAWDGGLYITGNFSSIDGVDYHYIARWDGSEWSTLEGPSGVGLGSRGWQLAVWDDGDGEALYVTGFFTEAGGLPISRIAKWDGSEWSGLGTGIDNGLVSELQPWDDGTGEKLYVGGSFTRAGGVDANRIATWDGAAWAPVTTPGGNGFDNSVDAFAVWNGSLYIGGSFGQAAGVATHRIARWDGSGFFPLLDDGINGIDLQTVESIQVHDDGGTGEALFVGGDEISTPNQGTYVGSVGKWDGTSWTLLTQPDDELPIDEVETLNVYDAGHPGGGPVLFAAGELESAGGLPASLLGFWVCDSLDPTAPMLTSPTHEIGIWSDETAVTVEWQGASDNGRAGLYAYSYLFDRLSETVPDDRFERSHGDAPFSVTSDDLIPGNQHYFHLKTCDRSLNCVTSHLGPFWVDDGSFIFADGFESGDTSAWSNP